MKKLWISCALSATLAMGLCACAIPQNNAFTTPKNEKQFYAFSAASAGSIIASMQTNAPAAALTQQPATAVVASAMMTAGGVTVTEEAVINKINGYMSMVEGLLTDGAYTMENTASERPEYAVKTTVTVRELLGGTTAYTLYYNETNVLERTENDEREQETERRANIAGVLVVEGVDYPMTGITESENELGETEFETTFTVTLSENSYIVVKQESETERNENEMSYAYALYENGAIVTQSRIALEQERGETEVEFAITENGATQVFFFESERLNGREVIKIRVGNAQSPEVYTVSVTQNADGTASYTYQTGQGQVNKFRP